MPPESKAKCREESVPLAQVTAFMRQFAHDLHNDLNSLDLAVSYISEFVTDATAGEELKRQRQTIRKMGRTLRMLSDYLQPPDPHKNILSADDLLKSLRAGVCLALPEAEAAVSWPAGAGGGQIAADFEILNEAFTEIFKNAFQHREPESKITLAASVQHGGLHLRLEEDKPVPPVLPEGAGGRPFVTVGRRAYGLGLFYAQRVIAAHGGALSAHYDSAARRYVTEITLPMETQAA